MYRLYYIFKIINCIKCRFKSKVFIYTYLNNINTGRKTNANK